MFAIFTFYISLFKESIVTALTVKIFNVKYIPSVDIIS